MPRSEPRDVVLRLLDGRSVQRELVLRGGRERPPLAIGQESAWRVEGAHVGAAHVMLAFNGTSLYVCALPGQNAILDGEPLAARWVEAQVPSILQFGSARLGIEGGPEPEEETQPPRPSRDEEVTCIDEARLRVALAASIPNGEITCVAAFELPAAARRAVPAAPPLLADSARTLAAPPVAEMPEDRADDDEATSIPPTIPSDDLPTVAPPSLSFGRTFAAMHAEPAWSRPSSPTIATPLEPSVACGAGDSLAAIESDVLAVSGESATGEPSGDDRAPVERATWWRVIDAWRRASRPKRALSILMGPAVFSTLLTLRAGAAVHHPAPNAELARAREEAPPITASLSPTTTTTLATPARERTSVAASAVRPKTSAVGLHETRTPERRALDTVASGLDEAAATQYEALAAAHPERVAFREAARILRERASTPHRPQE